MATDKFNEWLGAQFARGLTDIRLSVLRKPGCSAQALKNELMQAEATIACGRPGVAPRPVSVIPGPVARIIASTSL